MRAGGPAADRSPLTRTFVSTTALTRAGGTVTPDFADGAVDLPLQCSGALAAVSRANTIHDGPIFPLLLVLKEPGQEFRPVGGRQCTDPLGQFLHVGLGPCHRVKRTMARSRARVALRPLNPRP
jgi:hypothetical protein